MSNFLAVATVTACLSQILRSAVGADVPGATVTTVRPDTNQTGTPATGVNLFLYQVTPNGTWGNADLPTRRPDGQLLQRPQVALDVHYLMTFYGNDAQLEPQRLLGSVVRTLRARPLITRKMIQDTITNAMFSPFLAHSDLADQVELVKFAPLPLSLEELSKLWAVFFQMPYALSVAYQGTVVLIESDETPHPVLPVKTRHVFVAPIRRPVIEQVEAEGGPEKLIVAGGLLVIRGRQLRDEGTTVRIGGSDVPPHEMSNTRITVRLASRPFPAGALRPGAQGVQVIQRFAGTPPQMPAGVESNVSAFVLHPTITNATISNVLGSGADRRSADVSVTLDLIVGSAQRASLLLNEVSTTAPAAFVVAADARSFDGATLTFHITGVKAATYFVRVQVDGAESPLDLDPASPTFGPTRVIS